MCCVSQQWKTLTNQTVAKIRLDCIQRGLSSSIFEYFELIYQPYGCDIPEAIEATMYLGPNPRALRSIPPEGLLFLRKQSRNNACAEVYFQPLYQLTRMIKTSNWHIVIPPHKLEGIDETVHIQNRFEDEPPVFVGKPNNGRGGFCVQRPGCPWVTLDGGEKLSDSDVTPAPFTYGRWLLSLATRQGEDLCANFLREHVAEWTNEM